MRIFFEWPFKNLFLITTMSIHSSLIKPPVMSEKVLRDHDVFIILFILYGGGECLHCDNFVEVFSKCLSNHSRSIFYSNVFENSILILNCGPSHGSRLG